MSEPRHTAIVDWDGTAVPSMWPERPQEFMPGFVRNMRRLHEAGWGVTIFSARLSPWDPFTFQRRDRAVIVSETQYVRDLLDRHGLTFVDIWTKEGKPGGDVYIDDKAERYTGRPGSWDAVVNKVLLRHDGAAPLFPAFDQSAAK